MNGIIYNRLLLLLTCLLPVLNTAEAVVIYDTGLESTGTIGLGGGGTSVSGSQYLGVRFQADDNYLITAIGGHFAGTPNTTIFGAVLEIDGPESLPELDALPTDPGLVGVSVFGVPQYSEVVWADISGSLEVDAWYTLVFGSGLFGATGFGYTPFEDVTINTGANSYWFLTGSGFVGHPEPHSTLGYFGLHGTTIPEPSTLALMVPVLAGLCFFGRRRKLKHLCLVQRMQYISRG